MNSSRILTILVAVISVIGFVLFIRVLGVDEENVQELSGVVSPLVGFSLVLLYVTVGIAVVASFLGIFKNSGALKKTLLGVLGLGVVLLVSYLISDDGQVVDANKEVIAAAQSSVSKLTSTGIWTSLVLLVLGGAFFVFDLFKGLVK
ncbi:hypothetical protein [Tenacibaculum agarivorans]|uniref:hypothetical protein n=1 Tax=Tenacibaculum agarivorans TaxID=1908389 RepID=UPI00094BB6DA|nr:hypothetical protein [Tenacibaculum agarivorans]